MDCPIGPPYPLIKRCFPTLEIYHFDAILAPQLEELLSKAPKVYGIWDECKQKMHSPFYDKRFPDDVHEAILLGLTPIKKSDADKIKDLEAENARLRAHCEFLEGVKINRVGEVMKK